jgi:hypothetical protein
MPNEESTPGVRRLEVDPSTPRLRARVMSFAPFHPARRLTWAWTVAAVLAVLALAVVASLIAIRMVGQSAVREQAANGPSLTMLSRPGFTCSLPIQVGASAALVDLPDGRVTIYSAGTGAGEPGQLSYVEDGWHPVAWQAVAPDQQQLAQVTSTAGSPGQVETTSVQVYDIASGGGQEIWSGEGNGVLLGWGSAGIYFERTAVAGEPASDTGVWVVDPQNAAAAHETVPNPPPGSIFSRAGGDAAWWIASPTSGGPEVMRLDLQTGTSQVWYTAPAGASLTILGVDGHGHPVVSLETPSRMAPRPPGMPVSAPPPAEVLDLVSPQSVSRISAGGDQSFQPTSVFADSHGLWLGSDGAIWLYRQSRLQKVAEIPAGLFPAGGTTLPVAIAGPCQ